MSTGPDNPEGYGQQQQPQYYPQPGPQYGYPPQQPPPPSLPVPYYGPPYQPYPPYQQVAPKSPAVAVVASLFIPGLGSMISGNGGIGALILILYIVSIPLAFLSFGILGLATLGIWIWGMINAHGSARAWNAKHGIVS